MKITDLGAALDPQFERVEWRKKMSYAEDENYDGYDLEEDAETFKQVSQLERELAEAIAKERERCAKVCERNIVAPAGTYQILMAAAAAIRKGE